MVSADDEIRLGADAEEVLRNRAFQAAQKAVKDGINAQMRSVPMSDEKMHTRLILALQCWDVIERYLENAAQSGQLAIFTLEQEKEKKRRNVLGF